MSRETEGEKSQFQELKKMQAAFEAATRAAKNAASSGERLEHLRYAEMFDRKIVALKHQLGLASEKSA